MSSEYAERPHLFGTSDGLFGVLCRSTGPEPPDTPILMMVNAGLIHRVGPNRTYTHLARSIARIGIPSFRFDLSGIGDSDRREGVLSLADAVALDIAEALSFVESAEPGRAVVLLGICSGAFDAIENGLADPRIAGIVPIDPQGSFRNRRHGLYHYIRRTTQASSWRNALRNPGRALKVAATRVFGVNGRETSAAASTRAPSAAAPVRSGVRPRYSRASLGEKLDQMIESDVKALFVFTEGLEENYGYPGQFGDCYPEQCAHPGIGHAFIPGSDHTFSRQSYRDALVELVSNWLTTTRFPTGEGREPRRSAQPTSRSARASERT